jgi:hypothetical protein
MYGWSDTMSVNDVTRIDIRQFLQRQQGERYKAFVIHGPPLASKTKFARKLAEISPGGVYLDVLRYVIERPELAQQIDMIDVAALQRLVILYAINTGARLLLVDELDFLIPIWSDDLTEFKYMVRSLSVAQTPTVIGFILQTRYELEEWNLPNGANNQNRILHIENIQALQP